MKSQFLKTVFSGLLTTLTRFPLPVTMSIMASLAANFIIGYEGSAEQPEVIIAFKIIRTCFIGFPLLLAVVLFLEKIQVKEYVINLCRLGLAGVLLLYYFTLPERPGVVDDIRFVLFALAANLLVSFLPFFDRNDNNGFWQYNRLLFIRIITSVVFSFVLYIGLALALQAIHSLFDVSINEKVYVKLGIIIGGIFNSLFFLAGIPKNIGSLRHETHYPKGLKIFAQFVLLPLVLVYLIIIYSYSGKIIWQWQWPNGLVAYLVIGYAISGIFAFLLIEPIKHQQNNSWIKVYSKFFYITLLPMIVLLCLAVRVRVIEYGITENRYFLISLAVWLTGIALYFLISTKKNIKIIPITLFIITLLSVIGPWNAFNIAEWSQVRRFNKVVVENKLLENGKFTNQEKEVSLEVKKRLSAIIKYLNERSSLEDLQSYFDTPIEVIVQTQDSENKLADIPEANIMQAMGLDYVDRWSDLDNLDTEYFYYSANESSIKVISPYDLSMKYYISSSDSIEKENSAFTIDQVTYKLVADSSVSKLLVYQDNVLLTTFDVQGLSNKLKEDYQDSQQMIPASAMTLYSNDKNRSFMLVVDRMTLQKKQDQYIIIDVEGELFISL